MIRRLCIACCAALVSLACASPSHAQNKSKLEASYLALKVTLGIGGSRTVDSNSVNLGAATIDLSDTTPNHDDLMLTYGLALQYMVPLHRYFALGGQLGAASWQSSTASDNDRSRNMLFDLVVVPQGKLPVSNSAELYLAVPVGLSLDVWNEVQRTFDYPGGSASIEANTPIGWTIAVMAGARILLSGRFGAFTEVGYRYHDFSHDVTFHGSVLGVGASAAADTSLSFGQFSWNIGAFF